MFEVVESVLMHSFFRVHLRIAVSLSCFVGLVVTSFIPMSGCCNGDRRYAAAKEYRLAHAFIVAKLESYRSEHDEYPSSLDVLDLDDLPSGIRRSVVDAMLYTRQTSTNRNHTCTGFTLMRSKQYEDRLRDALEGSSWELPE